MTRSLEKIRRSAMWLALAGLVAGASLLSSCSTVSRTVMAPPQIEGATLVGNKVCAECHTNITASFRASPHARVHVEKGPLGGTSCETCHGAGSKHVSMGGGRSGFIINPRKSPEACFQCHLDLHAEFNLPHHHPVREGRLHCGQCHDPHGGDITKPAGGLAMARLNQSCAQCHREQARPMVFEHEALREGCVACHQPHGSINPKLLVERDANLCLKCHAQIQGAAAPEGDLYIGKASHTMHLRQGACWSSGCHTAVHGSNLNPRMFY